MCSSYRLVSALDPPSLLNFPNTNTSPYRFSLTTKRTTTAILYYDYILTLPDEIEYIWKNPRRLSTLFYFLCRYALAANLIYVLSIAENFTGLKVRAFTLLVC